MASAINSTVTIREIIYMYSEAAKKSEAEYLRLWRIAFRGFVQMGMNAFMPATEIELPVNANKTVTLPSNYLQWVSIREFLTDGTTLALVENAKLTQLADGNTSQNKHFRVDRENNCILLSPYCDLSTVQLQYVGSPEPDSDYKIPIQFQEAMIDWISWQDLKHMPATSHFGRGDKLDRAAQYRASLKLAKKMFKPFRVQQEEQYSKQHNITEQIVSARY